MDISERMLNAALQKATDAGLFPRRCNAYEQAANREIIRSILRAAMDEASSESRPAVANMNDPIYSQAPADRQLFVQGSVDRSRNIDLASMRPSNDA
jgi:hypothetical protein